MCLAVMVQVRLWPFQDMIERDWEFAKQFDLPIIEVVQGGDVEKEAYAGDGAHVNSGPIDGLNIEEGDQPV